MNQSLPPDRNPHFLRGLELFDAGDYHAAHDAIEELWLDEVGDVKTACKALIVLAVGLYHRENGNYKGARKLLGRAAELLQTLPPTLLQLDLPDLQRRAAALRAELGDEGTPEGAFDAALIPRFEAYRKQRE